MTKNEWMVKMLDLWPGTRDGSWLEFEADALVTAGVLVEQKATEQAHATFELGDKAFRGNTAKLGRDGRLWVGDCPGGLAGLEYWRINQDGSPGDRVRAFREKP